MAVAAPGQSTSGPQTVCPWPTSGSHPHFCWFEQLTGHEGLLTWLGRRASVMEGTALLPLAPSRFGRPTPRSRGVLSAECLQSKGPESVWGFHCMGERERDGLPLPGICPGKPLRKTASPHPQFIPALSHHRFRFRLQAVFRSDPIKSCYLQSCLQTSEHLPPLPQGNEGPGGGGAGRAAFLKSIVGTAAPVTQCCGCPFRPTAWLVCCLSAISPLCASQSN